jgi:tetratricopeptide (TPR) repeat protein
MTEPSPEWERRATELWARFDDYREEEFLAAMEALAGELSSSNPVGLYERASAFDSTGRSDLAVPLYSAALEAGLRPDRRRQAVIQMASSLRNLGKADESVKLLTHELDAGSDELDDAVRAFLALALVDAGRAREAVGVALSALSKHLPRYKRSLSNYAEELRAKP